MISPELFAEIKRDFYLGPDQYDLIIPPHSIGGFWNWVMANAIMFNTNNVKNDHLLNPNYLSGNCYGNSQNEARINGRNYCEGFAKIQGRYILHGFNFEGDRVIDVTAINNTDDFRDHTGGMPVNYSGIPIDTGLINEINGHRFAENLNTVQPLLQIHYMNQI